MDKKKMIMIGGVILLLVIGHKLYSSNKYKKMVTDSLEGGTK